MRDQNIKALEKVIKEWYYNPEIKEDAIGGKYKYHNNKDLAQAIYDSIQLDLPEEKGKTRICLFDSGYNQCLKSINKNIIRIGEENG